LATLWPALVDAESLDIDAQLPTAQAHSGSAIARAASLASRTDTGFEACSFR